MENPYQPFEEDSEEQGQVQFHQFNNIRQDNYQDGKHVRLRAVETEAEYFLKTMNVSSLRMLVWMQVGASVTVLIAQILLYGAVDKMASYKFVDYSGMGIWAPLLFFLVAAGLTWMATKYPSGCNIGTAMGFQITSAIAGAVLVMFAVISLIMHGRYDYRDSTYDAEVAGRIFCSFMILAAALVMVTSVFASVHFCRSICCGKQQVMESMMFDVVTIK